MAVDDFIMTMDSDVEDTTPSRTRKDRSQNQGDGEPDLNPEFSFDLACDSYVDILEGHNETMDLVQKGSKPVRPFSCSTSNVHYG